MENKAFIFILLGVLLIGGVVGGAFFGGVALGKNQGTDTAPITAVSQPSSIGGQLSTGQADQPTLDRLRERIASGEATQEELAQLRQQFQGQQGFGGGFGGLTGRGGLTGTIQKVEGNAVTVNTAQGILQVTIGTDTVIQQTATILPEELLEGMRVTVNGERDESGAVNAVTIFVIGEGAEGFQGRGFRTGGG